MVWRNWESVAWQHCKTYFIYYCAEFWKEYKAQVISQLKLYNLINQWVLIKQHCRLYLKSFITTSSLRHHARPNNYWSIFNDQTQIHLHISFFKVHQWPTSGATNNLWNWSWWCNKYQWETTLFLASIDSTQINNGLLIFNSSQGYNSVFLAFKIISAFKGAGPLWSQINAMVCLFATGRRKATGA